jgi:ribonuclease P protein component
MTTKFRKFFYFSKKELDALLKKTTLVCKEKGLKILQASPEKVEQDFGKLLVIIPKKSGIAVERNLIKRRLKSIFYEEQLFKKPINNVIIVYKNAMQLSFSDLKTCLVKNLNQHA